MACEVCNKSNAFLLYIGIHTIILLSEVNDEQRVDFFALDFDCTHSWNALIFESSNIVVLFFPY